MFSTIKINLQVDVTVDARVCQTVETRKFLLSFLITEGRYASAQSAKGQHEKK